MNLETDTSKISALEAKSMAQWIAFAPFVFQATAVMRDAGLLEAIAETGEHGEILPVLMKKSGLSRYGIKALLDFGVSIGLVVQQEDRYVLSKIGYFIQKDEMTRVNMDFTRDVCYRALDHLGDSIRDGKPRGLAELGDWDTLYEGLTTLPGTASESWFSFDHFYSDRVFDELLPIIFESPVREILDVGGNTGRWALRCLAHNPDVRVTIMDLPVQLKVARKNIEEAGFSERFNAYPADVLKNEQPFYQGADVIWMSQFLDCFAEEEILSILKKAAAVMDEKTELYIIELLWDRQKYEAASFSLNATSLYFTCVANGNSRMYHSSDLLSLINQAGLSVEADINDIGEGHTLLRCKKTA
ncbi:MAG: class I SAM-dependent methyltransferase [Gammaproteobacteria bacterium]